MRIFNSPNCRSVVYQRRLTGSQFFAIQLFREKPTNPIRLTDLHMLRIARQDARHASKRLSDMHAFGIDTELSNVFVVHGTAHLQNGQPATHLTEYLHVTKKLSIDLG